MLLIVAGCGGAVAGWARTMIAMLWAMLSEVLALVLGAVAAHPFWAASGALVAVAYGLALSRRPADEP